MRLFKPLLSSDPTPPSLELTEDRLRRRISLNFAAAIILTGFMALVTWETKRMASDESDWVVHTYSVMGALDVTLLHLVEVTDSARAFALTGQDDLLAHHETAKELLARDQATTRRLTADNPIQQRRLDVVDAEIKAALHFAESIVEKRRRGPAGPNAIEVLETETLMAAMRSTTQEMQTEEERLLRQRTLKAAIRRRLMGYTMIAGFLVGTSFLVLAKMAVSREIGISTQARVKMGRMNADLEGRIQDRTASMQAEIADRKATEKKRERTFDLIESSDDAIISKNLDGIITAWNPGAEKLFGYSSAEVMGKPMGTIVPAERVDEELDILARTGRGESVTHIETVRLRKDGTLLDVWMTISPIRNGSGAMSGALAIARDITERKRCGAALKESLACTEQAVKDLAEQKYALDQHAIVTVTDAQGTIIYANEKFCAISRYSENELIGKNHRIVNSGQHSKEFFQHMYQTIAEGGVWHGEMENRAKDGSTYWVDTTIVPFISENGKPEQYMAIRSDITERKRGEGVRDRLAAAVESSDDAIISRTLDGTITSWNPGAERLFGYSSSEILGRPLQILVPPERAHEESDALARIGRGEHVDHFETLRLQKNGTRIDVSVTISPIKDSNGAVVGASKIARDITKRRQVEEALHEQSRVLDLAQVLVCDMDGRIVLWSCGAEKLYGFTKAEAVGRISHQLLHSQFPQSLERIQEQLDHSGTWEGELIDRKRDGGRVVVASLWALHRDAKGKPSRILKAITDITDGKRAQEALQESEERFQTIANGIQQLAWMAGADGSIFWYNQRWYDYTGTTFEQTKGWSWESVHDPAVLPEVLAGWKAAIAASQPFDMEYPLRGSDGSFRMFLTRAMPIKNSEGRVVRWLGTHTDVSDRKLTEQKLAQLAVQLAEKAKDLADSRRDLEVQTVTLRSVLDSMVEGLVATDEHGKFVIWNPAAERILGMGASELDSREWTAHYGLFLPDLVTPFPSEQIPLERALRGEVSTTEMFVRNAAIVQGAWIEVSAGPMKDRNGTVTGGVAAFRDITQRRSDEREIRKLNDELELRVAERTAQLVVANEELESFSYSVSHDLRAPLRHIGGFSKLLVEEFGPALDPVAQQYAERIQAGAQKMGVLVDELLNLARVGRHAVNLCPCKLNALVREILTILQPDIEGRQVEWRIADLPAVECDPILVRQVFQNLLANALKFTRPRAQAVIEVNWKDENGQIVFMVRDNGVGFSMKYVDKLFGVFQRLHSADQFEGTGIGLVTVQRIVRKHGGRIWAEGEADRGAAFYFTLSAGKQMESQQDAMAAGG